MAKLQTDGFKVEFRTLGLDQIEMKVKDPTEIPICKPENRDLLKLCYVKRLNAAAFGIINSPFIILPFLGVDDKGWSAEESMKCAWEAVFDCSLNVGSAEIRTICFVCDEKEYPWVKEYRMNLANLFFTVPQRWNHHGDMFFWEFLMRVLSSYKIESTGPLGLLRLIFKWFFTVTGHGLEKGKTFCAQKEGWGKLSGLPISCDFQLEIVIPLILENFCKWYYDELGLGPAETVNVVIGDYEWRIPKECVWYLESVLGKIEVIQETEIPKNLKDVEYDKFLKHYRKRIPLDENRIYFLSVFYYPDGTIKKYSLDVEAASDSHIEFIPGKEDILIARMNPRDTKEQAADTLAALVEALTEFVKMHSTYDFIGILRQCDVKYSEFHYD